MHQTLELRTMFSRVKSPLGKIADLNRSQQLLWASAGQYLDASGAEAEWVPVRAPHSLPVSQGITTP